MVPGTDGFGGLRFNRGPSPHSRITSQRRTDALRGSKVETMAP